MRSLTLYVLFLTALPSLAHLSLSELQPIAGFSDACTAAYNTPLTPCTISDFYEGATCSAQCIAFLEAMTKLLNDDCRGTTAFPNTLIGMFFQKTAVKRLCPNVDVATVSAAGAGQGPSSPPGTPIAAPTETAAAFTSSRLAPTTPSQISIKITSTTSQTSTLTAAASTLSTTVASSTTSATASIAVTSANAASTPGSGDESAVVSPSSGTDGAATTSAGQANPTAASQENGGGGGGNNDGNGGTVLDAASAADHSSRASIWLSVMSAALATSSWLL
ncbi:MAG: hypothetical protein Q9219_006860 [cf. Caloplaca sp. 3 TL-2023]